MKKFAWQDSYCLGVGFIDAQHQKLFDIVNQLIDCCQDENPVRSEQFHNILSELFEYSRYHFDAEEGYMQIVGFPELEAHRDKHSNFIEDITNLSLTVATDSLAHEKLLDFLTDWLLTHILESDMQIRHFLAGGQN